MRRPPPQAQPRTPAPTGAPDAPAPLRGSEVAGLAESLYLRLFVLALGSLPLICGLAVVAALVRTHNADLLRTTALAAALAALAALALRAPVRAYRALRRRPLFSLGAPLVALTALTLDGVTYSPLSYPAAVSIAIPAFVCGRRWALAAATIISVGALTAATVRYGFGVIDAVGQGTAGYFVWALVLAGLAERFAHLAMQLAPVAPPPTDRPPPILVSTPNRDSSSAAPEPSRVRAPTAGTAVRHPLALRASPRDSYRCLPCSPTGCEPRTSPAASGSPPPPSTGTSSEPSSERGSDRSASSWPWSYAPRSCTGRPLAENLQPGQAARCCIPASHRGAGFLPQRASRA